MTFKQMQILGKTIGRPTVLRIITALILTLSLVFEANAESTNTRPKLVVPAEVSISETNIRLGNIARITSTYGEFDKLVEALNQVPLGEAPAPSMKISIPGSKILTAIQEAGISLDAVGYSIPQVVVVERKGHVLTGEDVLPYVRDALAKDSSLDLLVREVNWANAQVIPDGQSDFTIERLGRPQGGKVPLRINVSVDSQPAARFLATAIVDDWREVPVLNKNLERGMLISPEDVEVVRMNLFKQPPNVADSVKEVVGRRAKQRISAGETIKKHLIDIPPIIPAGKPISVLYRSGGVHATVTGVAMEDGFEDGVIKVKNDRSRRILKARVINADQVEVSPQ
jgi:flagellar basal body P-ring formation protein FlgA